MITFDQIYFGSMLDAFIGYASGGKTTWTRRG
jgi:hypothetical protein